MCELNIKCQAAFFAEKWAKDELYKVYYVCYFFPAITHQCTLSKSAISLSFILKFIFHTKSKNISFHLSLENV